MTKRWARTAAALAVTAVIALTSVGCRPKPEFYVPPDVLPPRNGDVIRTVNVLFDRDDEIRGIGVMYRSTDATGEPNAVTGTIYVPRTPWTGGGARPVVAFAPGTQGLGDRCAPSQSLPIGTNYEQGAVRALLAAGWAVAVTDYENTGPPGDPTYTVKDAEAHAQLDIVRAAQRIPDSGVTPASPVALWGYSQGGQSTAGALEIEATYAPELDVRAGVAGGVPSNLATMVDHLDGAGNTFFSFLAFAAVGLNSAYPNLDLESYLNDEGRALFDTARTGRGVCLADGLPLAAGRHISELTTSNPLDSAEWRTRLDQQALGRTIPAVPVFLYHGETDQIVLVDQSTTLRDAWCAGGATVSYRTYPVDHLGGINAGTADGVAYLTGIFAGQAAPSTC
jgi:hypothetical protein